MAEPGSQEFCIDFSKLHRLKKLPLGCVYCQNGKSKPLSGQANTSYVRKRKKIDFSLDSGEDSDEWDDGKKGKKKGKGTKGKRAGKKCARKSGDGREPVYRLVEGDDK